jgi:putative tricarboxylic transport membrane protein
LKHLDQYAGIFCFLLGGAITGSSFSYGVGSLSEPGPGFITFLAGAVLTVLSLILFIAPGKSKERFHGLRQLWEGRQTKKVFMILALLVAYMFLLTPIGFLFATFFLLLFLFRVQGSYTLRKVTLFAALATIVSFIIFDQLLGVQLPRGFLGYFLF